MAERRTVRQRIARRPAAVRFRELQQLLEAYGWSLDRISGSYYIFVRDGEILTLPYRRPHVSPAYVFEVLRRTREEADDE